MSESQRLPTSLSVYLLFVLFALPQNLYDSIKNEPFKIPEDDGNDLTHTFFNPDREGWLLKLGTCTRVDFSKSESDADVSSVKNANKCKV